MAVRKHGLSRTSTYYSYRAMLRRCFDSRHRAYESYGGRGIRVYFDWLGEDGFEQFVRDVGMKPDGPHDLDRINSDGHYEPGNVRWAPSPANRARNRGSGPGDKQVVEAKDWTGRVRRWSLGRWAKHLRISYRSLKRRLQRGWGDRAFAAKPRGR